MEQRSMILSIQFALVFLSMYTLLISQEQPEWIKVGNWHGREKEYVAGQIAIKVKPGVTKEIITPIVQALGGKFLEEIDVLRWTTISVPKESDILKMIEQLRRHPLIEVAEPNSVGSLSNLPNDPYFRGISPATYPHQYGLRNMGQSPSRGTYGADIKAEQAWDITTGSSSRDSFTWFHRIQILQSTHVAPSLKRVG